MTPDECVEEVRNIVSAGEKRGIILRLTGGLVVRCHCKKYLHLYDAMKRKVNDLDFITYSQYRERLKPFFIEMGYKPDERFLAYFGHKRQKYYNESNGMEIDLFIDKLEMCHNISFKGRLELDSPTITLADFILTKMQIVELNEKDIKDTVVILREHEVGESDNETINAKYIAKVLSKDWGFYYTVTSNLKKVKNALQSISVLRDEDRVDVSSKINKLLKYIVDEPKTLGWKIRASIGTKKKWYTDVEEVVR